jgi:hypothetical protein
MDAMLVSAILPWLLIKLLNQALYSTYLGMVTPVYSFSLFLPSIIAAMGYSAARSQLLTVVSRSSFRSVACTYTLGNSLHTSLVA